MARGQGRSSGAARDGYRGPSAPPVAAPTWKRRLYVDRPPDLAALAQDLAAAHVIAIDAEFVQVYRRAPGAPSHRLALLQFAVDNEYRASYVLDTLRLVSLEPLQASLADGNILKLFHGVSADLRMLASRDLAVRHILDLEAVSRSVFGQRESGLQSMLRRACDVRLDKSLQRADWARRPLTPAMVAYAARDAEMTYALYGWLAANYPWAVALHEQPADEPPPGVAPWIVPFLDGGRGRVAEVALAEAGLAGNVPEQERALRHALAALRHPGPRVRVFRLIADLGLAGLAPELRPYLDAPASEERAGAVRTLGRLRDTAAQARIAQLLDDPVEDVRQAARIALDFLGLTQTPAPVKRAMRHESDGRGVWVVGGDEPPGEAEDDWRSALRARFGVSPEAGEDDESGE
jgi:hypothetical protein